MKHIAVICLDNMCFRGFLEKNKIRHQGINTQKRIKFKTNTYYCVSKLSDLCSIRFNYIVESDNAKLNMEYDAIISAANNNLI